MVGKTREISCRKDESVSEIIGTLLIFSILVILFSTFIIWYVPYTGQQYESQYETSTQEALSGFTNQLFSPSLQPHSLLSENIPMGVEGDFFNHPSPSQLSFGSNFNISYHYNVGIDISYSGNTPSSLVSNNLYKTLPVGASPDGVAVDTANNTVFVVNSNYSTNSPGNLTVINGGTDSYNSPVKNINLLGYPTGIAYDPASNVVFVTEGNLSTVVYSNGVPSFSDGFIQVISGTNVSTGRGSTIVRTLYFSSTPFDITYVSYLNSVMFTTYFGSGGGFGGAVIELNASNYAQTAYILVAQPSGSAGSGILPSSISYDPANGYVYVALGGLTLGMAVINPITSQIIKHIVWPADPTYGTSPWSNAYDLSNGKIFTTESFVSNNNQPSHDYPGLLLINGSSNGVIANSGTNFNTPVSLVYDNYNHFVYVSDFGANTVYIFNGSNLNPISPNGTITSPDINGPGNGPNAMAWNSDNGQIYVPNFLGNSVSIINGSTVLTNIGSTGKHFKPVNTINGSGQLKAFASTSFVTQNYYNIQDGFLVQQGAGNNFGEILNGLPLSFNHHGGIYGLSTQICNFTGSYGSLSQNGNYLLTGAVQALNRQSWNRGENLTFVYKGTQYSVTITNIVLYNMTMTIRSDAISAWNYSFYQQFGSSRLPFNPSPSGTTWTFADGVPLKAIVSKGELKISTISSLVYLSSFSYEYLQVLLNI